MPSKAREGRDGQATRAAILDTARSQFGSHGFERTTIRSVASQAGVDPALVMHYFGSKAELFAAASRFDITFPDLSDVAPDRIADVLLPLFITVWGPQGPFLPLLRARPRRIALPQMPCSKFSSTKWPRHYPRSRPIMLPSGPPWWDPQLLGLAVARYILGVPPLAGMDDAHLIEWLRPVLAHYLADPAP